MIRALALVCVLSLACGPLANPGQVVAPTEPAWGGNSGTQARAQELSGGSLALSGDGAFAVVAEPERDRLWVVDLERRTVRGKIELPADSRPGRMLATGPRSLAVALRGTGQVALVDLAALAMVSSRHVCAEPFSLASDPRDGATVVGCLGGEVARLPAEASAPTSMIRGPRDLRDVLFLKGELVATTFRSAEVLKVAERPSVFAELPNFPLGSFENTAVGFVPRVAWRAVSAKDGRVLIAHQREVEGNIAAIQLPGPPSPAYYSNTCSSAIVRSALTVLDPNGGTLASAELPGVLPVDVAVSEDAKEAAVAFAGSNFVARLQLDQLPARSGSQCQPGFPSLTDFPTPTGPVGQPTGVAFRPNGTLVVHTRVPFGVSLYPRGSLTATTIPFDARPVLSDAQALFHTPVGGLACASCHPEGRDDGHTWTLQADRVRTQSLAGGISKTLPFHWKGELKDLKTLMGTTFVSRMGGPMPDDSAVTELQRWVDGVPLPKVDPIAQPDVVGHGAALFAKGCGSCHAGAMLTTSKSYDVGTGAAFQVPVLRGVALRGPFMHNGCATTLKDRFGACGGGAKHGDVAQLTPADLDALAAYLDTL